MKIVKLTVENIMRVSAVDITPEGNVVVIGGNNGQGKSSVLTAIEMALGGKGHVVGQPVRLGAEKGRVTIDLGQITVERTFTATGGTRLVVREASGAVFQSPQAMLDHLVGVLTFDPLDFARAAPKKQAEILRAVAKIDTAEVDAARAKAFAQRTDVNREVQRTAAQLDAIPPVPEGLEVPAEAPDVASLMRQLEALNRRNDERLLLKREADKRAVDRASASAMLNSAEVELQRLEIAIARQRDTVAHLSESLRGAEANLADADAAWTEAQAQLESSIPLKDAIASSQKVDALVRTEKQRAKLREELAQQEARAADLTSEIEACDEQRRSMIADAPFPVPGLGVEDDGVTFNGIPFSQASGAEKLRASVAIGIALNPKLKVMLVRDGSLLDDDGLKLLSELAAKDDMQVWVERVGKGEGASFIIEDGRVDVAAERRA